MNLLLIACLFALAVNPAIADDDKPATKSVPGTVFLSSQAQTLSGLQMITLAPVNHQAEFTCFGKAVSIQALVELRHRYFVALSEHGGATARFKQAGQNSKRQQGLYLGGATSKRNLQVQQAQWQIDKAQLEASEVQAKAIMNEAELNWGNQLAEWALSNNPDKLGVFLSGQKTLLLISLPVNKTLAEDVKSIYIEASGNRSTAYKAQLISAAVQIDNTVQGESYYFWSDGRHIRTGMRVTAWIPEENQSSGVLIPKSALIWYMDQAFVYIKMADEQFGRRTVKQFSAATGGYFVGDGLQAGEQVVITGGQMLLSEELRGQIPNEDD
jgi:hypothetical protein